MTKVEMTKTKVWRNLQQLPDGQKQVLRAAMLVLASWDADLFAHSEQVAHELLALAPQGHEEEWYWAGLLHDIGKIAVAPDILRKRGGLSRRERKAMQQHSLKGAALLKQIGAPQVVVDGAQFHHERWDGTGYPYDIGGEQIPFVARVLAAADAYAALTRDRPYRRALASTQARLEIERHAGTQFDPQIVERFFERMRDER
jgi:polar amino acid transport system substrate-binding protein